MAKVVSKTFTVRLEGPHGRLKWVTANIPLDVKATWGSSRVRVRGVMNGFEFRTSLFPRRDGTHFLLVNKALQRGARVRPGDSVKVTMENDIETRTAEPPVELEHELKQSKALRKWFDQLSLSMRRYFAQEVSKPKSPASRKRRAEHFAETLYLAMDAEQELPPILRTAFARRPRAYDGWMSMSPIQKRHTLLSIFYQRTPEVRERRIEKMLDEAEARAEKESSK